MLASAAMKALDVSVGLRFTCLSASGISMFFSVVMTRPMTTVTVSISFS